MPRFTAYQRYLMHIDAYKGFPDAHKIHDTSLLADLSTGGRFDGAVIGLDMSSWLEPAIQLAMVDQQERSTIGGQDKGRDGEMAGIEF